ncbi:hypothetical protein ACFQ07_16825, partial [Actinomadura adrarensis]
QALVALVAGTTREPGEEGPERLLLSAIAPELVERVLSGFVDEILTGQVTVMGVARAAGTKSKIAVAARSHGVDARAACTGRSANRINAAERLLNRRFGREKLEIIEFSRNRAAFLANAMKPLHVTDVLIDHDNAVVSLEEQQLSGDISAAKLDAELAGRLTGLHVRVVEKDGDLRTAMGLLRVRHTAVSAPKGGTGKCDL